LALDTPAALKRSVDAVTFVRVHTDGETAGLADALARMAGATHADAADGEVRVYLGGVSGVLPRVVDAAEAAGFSVTDLSINEPTLEAAFSTLLMAGVVATTMVFQGVQAVALPLVQEFGFTKEIEDRVMAPLPVWAVAAEKIVSGAAQGLLAALVVFPLAIFIPATPVHLTFRWGFL